MVVASVIHEKLIGLDTSTRLVLPANLSKAIPKAQASTAAPSPGSASHAVAGSTAASAQRAIVWEEEEQSAASAGQDRLRPSAPPPTLGACPAATGQPAAAQEWAFVGSPTAKKSALRQSRAAPAAETVQAPPARLAKDRLYPGWGGRMGRVWESGSDEDAGEDEGEEEEEPVPQPPKQRRRLLKVLDLRHPIFGTSYVVQMHFAG